MTDAIAIDTAPGTVLALVDEPQVKIEAARAAELDKLASDQIASVVANPGDLRLIDSIANVAAGTQKEATEGLDLLQERVNVLMSRAEGPDADLLKGLPQLRMELKKLDPIMVSRIPWYHPAKLFSWFPGYEPMREALEQIRGNYQTIQQQIHDVEKMLEHGEIMANEDLEQVLKLADHVKAEQPVLEDSIYLTWKLYAQTEAAMKAATDPATGGVLQEMLYDISARLQALVNLRWFHEQALIACGMTVRDGRRLIRSARNTRELAPKALAIALSLQVAREHQRRVAAELNATNEYMNTVVENMASGTTQNAKDIAKLYENGVLQMQTMVKAHTELLKALDEQETARAAAIEQGKKVIAFAMQAGTELQERREGKSLNAPVEMPSLEAAAAS
jgi:uncharacterized protein YaaN involved in tellurite resistance